MTGRREFSPAVPAGTSTAPPAATPPPARDMPPGPAPLLLRAVLDASAEAVVVCAADHTIVLVNAAAQRLLPGVGAGNGAASVRAAGLARAARDGHDTFVDEHGGRRIRGRRAPLDADHYAWYLHDRTEEMAWGAALAAERARAAFLAEAGRRLSASLHRRRCARTTVELAVSYLADLAVVVLSPDRRRVEWLRAVAGGDVDDGTVREQQTVEVPGLAEALAGFPPASSRWLDPAQAPPWLLPAGFGRVGALLVTPLPGNGMPAGALVLARRATRAETDDEASGGHGIRGHGPGDRRVGDHDRGDHGSGGHGFDDDDEQVARVFAARAGAAISAATLYHEQVDTTAVLQADLLPPTLPAVDGVELVGAYRAATESLRIGGDFYDVFPPAGRASETMVVLGDVCGTGPQAAVLTGKVRQTLRALRLVEHRPDAMLHVLNQALLQTGNRTRFVTLVLGTVARVDHGRVRMTLAAAGHPAPLVLRRDGTVEEVATRGTLIGAVRQTVVRPAVIELAPGELCLLYSDGLTEARGGHTGHEPYGDERLHAALASCRDMPAAAVVERVEQLASDWVNGGGHDDIAMLAVRAPARTPLTLAGVDPARVRNQRIVDTRRTVGRGRHR